MLTPCEEIKKLRKTNYDSLLDYINSKIKINYLANFIYIDEDEVIQFKINFNDSVWKNLIKEAGYEIEYCDFVVPTIRISGWSE